MAFLLRGLRNRAVLAAGISGSASFFALWHSGADDDKDRSFFLAGNPPWGRTQIGFCDAPAVSSPSTSVTLLEHRQFLGSAADSPTRKAVMELLTRMQLQIHDRVNALERQHTPAGKEPTQVLIDIDDRRDQGKRGIAMAIQDGAVFEKGGFSLTLMSKPLSAGMAKQMSSNHAGLKERLAEAAAATSAGQTDVLPFSMWVCGLSLILHPRHPLGATVHLNYRYFEVLQGDEVVAWWFGGGNDLTPIYFDEGDAKHFHRTLKDACDRHKPEFYPEFKAWADKYFYHTARKEARGVGGVFFDDLDESRGTRAQLFGFVKDCLEAFPQSYFPRLEQKLDQPVTDAMREWQALRHGRYVEFNLIYDRGTKFGFHVPGVNIENVLISLPLTVRFEYKNQPAAGSREAELLELLTGSPREYV